MPDVPFKKIRIASHCADCGFESEDQLLFTLHFREQAHRDAVEEWADPVSFSLTEEPTDDPLERLRDLWADMDAAGRRGEYGAWLTRLFAEVARLVRVPEGEQTLAAKYAARLAARAAATEDTP